MDVDDNQQQERDENLLTDLDLDDGDVQDQSDDEDKLIRTYLQQYTGHISSDTIKVPFLVILATKITQSSHHIVHF